MDVFQSCVGKGTAENERSVAKSLLSYEASKQSVKSLMKAGERKIHYCLYCRAEIEDCIQQHWFRQHDREGVVQAILSEGSESTRRELTKKLIDLGDEYHKLTQISKSSSDENNDCRLQLRSYENQASSTNEVLADCLGSVRKTSDPAGFNNNCVANQPQRDIQCFEPNATVASESFCYYCGILQLHIERHWFATHPYEPEVAEILRLKDDAERMRLVCELKNLGNHKHNGKVLSENESSFLMNRVSSKHDILDACDDFATCRKCFYYLPKKELQKHKCQRQEAERDNREGDQTCNKSVKPFETSGSSAVMRDLLFGVGESGSVKFVARTDKLIMCFAEDLVAKRGMGCKTEISQAVCDLARFLIEMRRQPGMATVTMAGCIKPQRFNACVLAVKSMAGFIKKTKSYKDSFIAARIGRALLQLANIVRNHAELCENDERAKSAECFIQLCASKWLIETPLMKDPRNPFQNQMPQTSEGRVRNDDVMNFATTEVQRRSSEADLDYEAYSSRPFHDRVRNLGFTGKLYE
jgi:hypothetical protein